MLWCEHFSVLIITRNINILLTSRGSLFVYFSLNTSFNLRFSRARQVEHNQVLEPVLQVIIILIYQQSTPPSHLTTSYLVISSGPFSSLSSLLASYIFSLAQTHLALFCLPLFIVLKIQSPSLPTSILFYFAFVYFGVSLKASQPPI